MLRKFFHFLKYQFLEILFTELFTLILFKHIVDSVEVIFRSLKLTTYIFSTLSHLMPSNMHVINGIVTKNQQSATHTHTQTHTHSHTHTLTHTQTHTHTHTHTHTIY
uniref:Uncharacterized protein n=1 Tax=Octopus bimaculoides TaxID=37653 RepID=A0A0L8HYV1_OCTBM